MILPALNDNDASKRLPRRQPASPALMAARLRRRRPIAVTRLTYVNEIVAISEAGRWQSSA